MFLQVDTLKIRMGEGKFPVQKPDVVTAEITDRLRSSPTILCLKPRSSEKPLFLFITLPQRFCFICFRFLVR